MAYPAENYSRSFMLHRNALTLLLDKIPDDQGDFKAWDEGMSFKSTADHLSSSTNYVISTIQGQAPEKLEPSADYAAAKAQLQTTTTAMQKALADLSEEQLNSTVNVLGGRDMPLYSFIDFMREHEAHHKGQLWTMARMIGVAPGSLINAG